MLQNVTKTLKEICLIFILYVQLKDFLEKKFANYIDPYNHKNYKIKEKKRLNKVQFTCRQ